MALAHTPDDAGTAPGWPRGPLLTQSVTTMVLFAVGDVTAQQVVEKRGLEKHDAARTGRMALYGGGASALPCTSCLAAWLPGCLLASLPASLSGRRACLHPVAVVTNCLPAVVFGPAAATWYKFLQRNVNLASPNATVAARVACDQLLFAPTFIGVFLSSMALLEGGSPREKLDKNYTTALSSNYLVWPLVQALNFKMVPLEHRVLFVNVVSIGWNCYLSYLNSSK